MVNFLPQHHTLSASSSRLRPPLAPINGSHKKNTTEGTSLFSQIKCTYAAEISAKTRDGFPSALVSPRLPQTPRKLLLASAPTFGIPISHSRTIKATKSRSTAFCTTAGIEGNAKMHRTCQGMPRMLTMKTQVQNPRRLTIRTTKNFGFPSGPALSFSMAIAPMSGSPRKNTT